jgi:hypothetical protein
VGRRVPLRIRAEPDLPRGAFGPWPRASASSRDRCRSKGALSAFARTRVFHRDGRGRRQDAGRRAHDRAGDREAENPEVPPCEDGLSAASTESRSRDPQPPTSTPRTSSTGEPASLEADAAPLSNASGSAPRGRDGSRLGPSSTSVKDYFQHCSSPAAARSRAGRAARLRRRASRKGPPRRACGPSSDCRD